MLLIRFWLFGGGICRHQAVEYQIYHYHSWSMGIRKYLHGRIPCLRPQLLIANRLKPPRSRRRASLCFRGGALLLFAAPMLLGHATPALECATPNKGMLALHQNFPELQKKKSRSWRLLLERWKARARVAERGTTRKRAQLPGATLSHPLLCGPQEALLCSKRN